MNFSGVEKKFEIELVVPVDLAPWRVLLKLERRETRIYTFWKYQTFILKQLKDAQQLHLLFFLYYMGVCIPLRFARTGQLQFS